MPARASYAYQPLAERSVRQENELQCSTKFTIPFAALASIKSPGAFDRPGEKMPVTPR